MSEQVSTYLSYISEAHLGDLASVIGLFVSIIGFIITIINVVKSKNAASLAKDTVENIQKDIKLYQAVNGFSNALVVMDEIKRLHRQKEWSLLPDKYNSLRKSLVVIKCDNLFLSDNDKKEIQSAITQFSGLENLIDKHLSSKSESKIDVPKINTRVSKQIDRIQELLVKLNAKVGENNVL